MKNKIAIASAFIAASSFSTAEIVVNEFLSFEGFIDMSYSHYDGDLESSIDGIGKVVDESGSNNSYQIDQVEISWLFDFDPVTAQIDLEYEDNSVDGDGDTEVEQAFVTYHFDNGGAITAGRYASMLGFEAFEPTGLYQYSFAYGLPSFLADFDGLDLLPSEAVDLVAGTIFTLPGYSQGVKYTQESDNWFFGASLKDGVYAYDDRLGGSDDDLDAGGYGVELAAAYFMDNGLSFFLGGAYEDGDGYSVDGFDTGDTDAWVLNTYVTYEVGSWFFAAELNYGENEWDDVVAPGLDLESDSLSGLVMANFAYSEKASVTGRVSYVTYELDADADGIGDGEVDLDMIKYTLAHNYAFTDNLLLVCEVSYTDYDSDADGTVSDGIGSASFGADAEGDELLAAIELLFSF